MSAASSRHSLDSLLGDDPGGGGVEDLLEALQLEPVHPAGRHNIARHSLLLLLSLSRLSVTHCYIRAAASLPAARVQSKHT